MDAIGDHASAAGSCSHAGGVTVSFRRWRTTDRRSPQWRDSRKGSWTQSATTHPRPGRALPVSRGAIVPPADGVQQTVDHRNAAGPSKGPWTQSATTHPRPGRSAPRRQVGDTAYPPMAYAIGDHRATDLPSGLWTQSATTHPRPGRSAPHAQVGVTVIFPADGVQRTVDHRAA